jgi:uncharacterized protein (DUF2141 family)
MKPGTTNRAWIVGLLLVVWGVLGNARDATELVDVEVNITGLRNRDGQVLVALFADPKGFPENSDRAFARHRQRITQDAVRCSFAGISKGELAVAVVHDENGNGKLDKSFWGIPREGTGSSGNPKPKRRAPRFDESKVNVQEKSVLNIEVIYPD